ncbi:hypothetical protein TWF694_007399 [Orbilia ellipsospora]|uniref:Uncharacterized protein n=1 Tax=Orbilia ellipsospora TaxID=2528407 RepID=A0AAV9XHK9_9PEZI
MGAYLPNASQDEASPGPTPWPVPYKHSSPVPTQHLDNYVLKVEPRINHVAAEERRLIEQLDQEWLDRGGPAVTVGSLNHQHGPCLSLIFPEGNPDKILNITRLFAFGYIQDDWYDEDMIVEMKIAGRSSDDVKVAKKNLGLIVNQMRSQLVVELLDVDPEVLPFVQGYGAWEDYSHESLDARDFENLKHYLDGKWEGVGNMAMIKLIPYFHNLNLTRSQKAKLSPLDQLCSQAVVLTNDMFSFEKEWSTYILQDRERIPPSSIFITMLSHDVSIAEAMTIVRGEIVETEGTFLKECRRVFDESSSAEREDFAKYIAALQYYAAGAMMWHINHPRYKSNPDCPFYAKLEYKISAFERILAERREGRKKDVNGHNLKDKIITSDPEGIPTSKQKLNGAIDVRNGNQKDLATYNSVSKQPSFDQWESEPAKISEEEIVLKPFEYIGSLPSKRIRRLALNALDHWYNVPQDTLDTIDGIIDILHSSSLIIDDIEDNSSMRRGFPSAHGVFGVAQSINTANFLFVKCLDMAQQLPNSEVAVKVFTGMPVSIIPDAIDCLYNLTQVYLIIFDGIEELRNLHLGQGYDLNWTFNGSCPTEAEYIKMIDGKTGGLFRMAARLMQIHATQNHGINAEHLLALMGRFFQIRDDYQNLASAQYSTTKGDLSDLDEGKYSLVLIHALNNLKTGREQLEGLLRLRYLQGGMNNEQKRLVMRIIDRSRSLQYTEKIIHHLEGVIERTLVKLETQIPEVEKNWAIRAIMALLRLNN